MSQSWFDMRTHCPACASDKFDTIYRCRYTEDPVRSYLVDYYTPVGLVEFKYLESAEYILCECSGCGLIFQRDIPNDSLMERLYEKWIDPQTVFRENHLQKNLDHYAYCAQEIMQVIAYFGRKPSSLRLLDFGMGWGRWALMAKAFGCVTCGTELSPSRIKHARANGIRIISWEEIPNFQFDFINTEQVFEHLSKPLETLSYLNKALNPGGMIKISVPNTHDIDRRLEIMDWKAPRSSRNSLNPIAPLEHINTFRRSSLLRMAEESGMAEVFIPLKIQYKHLTDFGSLQTTIKSFLQPIYRNLLKKQNYVFLRNNH
jgi:2-polyprenyl-3-methyl-5-hydroxy-6-metoxy-1,4-benzoquinol methylase